MLHLHTLLRQFDPSIGTSGVRNVVVRGISDDSRQVEPGHVFVARAGNKADGRAYVEDAHRRGAVAVVTDSPIASSPLPQVRVKDAAFAAARLAHLYHEEPTKKVSVLGVTGTNGKTTTTYLIRHLLASIKRKCGMIGTVEIDDGRSVRESVMTTPGAVETARLLAQMRDRGCWACAMEVSSHALHQERVAGIHFAGAAFTNLTGDHLDYHGNMTDYAAAKAKLFEMLDAGSVAVINANDKHSEQMIRGTRGRIIRFGIGRKGDYRATDVKVTSEGSQFVLVTPDGEAEVSMSLIGKHNIANALTAAALVGEVFQMSVQQIAAGLATATGAPGRLQPVRLGQPFAVFVDYAHTDDGLKNVLSALRKLTRGSLRVVFGCGGDRDNTKRPRMARIAERYADILYITSDNPRTEDPRQILAQIVAGLSSEVELVGIDRPRPSKPRPKDAHATAAIVEEDRRTAIERALHDALPGDVVLLAGKGHENYQIIGADKRHFDDVEEAARIIKERIGAAA